MGLGHRARSCVAHVSLFHTKATASLNKLAERMSRDHILDRYVPLVDRLTSGTWRCMHAGYGYAVAFGLSGSTQVHLVAVAHWYNLRASACALYPTLYKVVGDEQFKLNVLQCVGC